MSEIPEYLLKKSREAKAAKLGLAAPSGDPAATPAGSSAVSPAAQQPAAEIIPSADLPYLDPPPVPDKPEPKYITAAKNRKKIPIWAMPVVAALPVWAYGLAGTLQQPITEDALLVESAEIYASSGCSGCHGVNGEGNAGSGYQFSDGEILQTFPDPIDHMVHVVRGSVAIAGQEYGAVRSNGSRRVSGSRANMPAQEKLTLEQIEMVVFHERAILSDEDQTKPGYEEWVEHMHENAESGKETPIDLEFLLACANPEVTPGATGLGSDDPEGKPCPGPHSEEEKEDS